MNKAKITITVPYDDIPHEVENLISRSKIKMHEIVDNFKDGSIADHKKTLENIQKAREQLILVDANLEDAYHILLGYMKAELDSKMPEQELKDES